MPRTHTLLPSSSSSSQYSKDNKSKKPIFQITQTSTPHFTFFIISSIFRILSFYTISNSSKPPSIFRCGRVQDTFRTFHPLTTTTTTTTSRTLGGGDHHHIVNNGLIERSKLLGFVGIQTGFSSLNRRDALRSTWFPSNHHKLIGLEQATGIASRFVIGRSKDVKKMRDLQKEVNKYHDFMLIDVEEEYVSPPYKTLAFFKAAFELFEADYYVKADDNIYLRPDRLSTLLAKERSHPMTYIGCMKKGPVITDPKMKWYEKSGHLIGNEYFSHAYGPIYALSAEIVASLASSRNDSLRMFSNEDVTVGSWMLAMNVHHEDNRAICDPRCTPTSIAVWDFPKCSGNIILLKNWNGRFLV